MTAGSAARPSGGRRRAALVTIGALVAASAAGALISARITFGLDGWLWNLDLPKVHYPLAVFYHEALAAGRLPLWQDTLGLGFPLYAEGQVGAFYPPHWLVFQLEPLLALDVTRLVHLTLAGAGAGLIGLRLSGSRQGALVAALVAVMGGAIVTKLEWWNVVAAYAWMPWVLLPLAVPRAARRVNVAAAGVLWGIQALTGHPNTWLLTGLAAVVLLLRPPWLASIGRALAFGLIGVGVGMVQLLPTALMRDLSARAEGLTSGEVFMNTSTPFDVIGAGFVNAFLRSGNWEWDYGTQWFPDAAFHFPILEASVYLGLPVLALAGLAVPARRARRWLVVAGVLAMVGVVPAFRPELWTDIPIVNGLRAPVRAYMVVSFAVAVLAAVGVSRLGRTRAGVRWGMAVMAVPVAGYLLLIATVSLLPALFDALMRFASNEVSDAGLAEARQRALGALLSPWPFLAELALALGSVVVILRSRSVVTVSAAVVLAVTPLALFMPFANPVRGLEAFSSASAPVIRAIRQVDAHRVLTIDRPAGYVGYPNQLAAAGVPDIEMFSSLNLAHVDDVVVRLRYDDPGGALRRALGIDVVVTFGTDCPGSLIVRVDQDDAHVCRDPRAATPPYWLPAAAARVTDPGDAPPHAELDPGQALGDAVPLTVTSRSPLHEEAVVETPAAGWVLFDRAWWPAWAVTVDGVATPVYEALGGQLVAVPAGHHLLVATLTAWDATVGALVGVGTLAGGVAWVRWPRPRRSRSKP